VAFVDYVKAFDKVSVQIILKILRARGFPQHLISATQNRHKNTKIKIECSGKMSEKQWPLMPSVTVLLTVCTGSGNGL